MILLALACIGLDAHFLMSPPDHVMVNAEPMKPLAVEAPVPVPVPVFMLQPPPMVYTQPVYQVLPAPVVIRSVYGLPAFCATGACR